MTRLVRAGATLAIAGIFGVGVAAQNTVQVHPGTGGSPHVRTSYTIDGAALSIEYGRPSLKGRPEATLMPAGQPWRAGADEATLLTTDKPLKFGALSLAPGTYTINVQPGTQWQIVLGKLSKPGQWGVPYNATLEIGRAPMTVSKTSAPVEQLIIAIDDTPSGAAFRLEWGTTRATAAFTIG
ncbi:MAG: DUF2911 domain-containing protein [Acidobacteria bacterium]|nr:DUF2911 domain-containing protein [Acidobacteriota bacterium]